MIHAVTRLIIITLVTVSLTFIAVFTARKLGSNQTFQTPPHDWFKSAEWTILDPGPEICDAAKRKTFVETKPTAILIRVRLKDGDWRLVCPGNYELSGFLKDAGYNDWLVRVEAKETWELDKLVAILSAADGQMRFGIHSYGQKVNRYIRKKGPQWVYAADTAMIARLKFFESLYLEPTLDFWPDFVIASTDRKKPEFVDQATKNELIRRQKRVIVFEGNLGRAM